MQTFAPAIELRGLTKTFGPVVANRDIDLTLRYGEILALLGENGSGKTTLMNMLSGLYAPDSGSIAVGGKPAQIRSPRDAQALGIGMIHQHFKLVEMLTVEENIVLGTPKMRGGGAAVRAIEELSARFGLAVDPSRKVHTLSVGEKQTVEILKVLYRGSRILILDEPTAVLTPQEIDKLFDILRRMRAEGCAVIIITHKLNEVLAISDRVAMLRKGESVATVNTKTACAQQLTELMVGRAVDLSIERPGAEKASGVLEVLCLTVPGRDRPKALDDVSFSLAGGEILGVAGVAGSGQKELCEAIAGLHAVTSGSILHQGVDLSGLSPREIIARGVSMSFIPEDRLGMGLVGGMGMVDNMLLKSYHDQRGPLLDRKPAEALSKQLIERLEISTPGVWTPVRRLSGGNVQKVLLGREIASGPRILITAYPVRGLDINSSMTIYRLLNEQKQRGVAILYIGEDLDVLLELCDRILVLCGGRVTGIADARAVNKQQIGLMMTGATLEEATQNA
ncbi:MAG: ABC transporter ATP-binding protein [Christensenellaceae bacterium]|nr:ABC transporter ATP-binding protein [Christensenellaceae bacterium]MEA5066189.1 ABC transporter ATP-binding protein [Eubacteriales bacterium]MEA5069358.1 ABC transporter ATP-binding protein [Christensenellaceae bacterium]